jgi:hypothetical protein
MTPQVIDVIGAVGEWNTFVIASPHLVRHVHASRSHGRCPLQLSQVESPPVQGVRYKSRAGPRR